jgi:hypothetical protein
MNIINFSHPLTKEQRAGIESLSGRAVAQVIDVKSQFDNSQPFTAQTKALVESVGLSPEEWQTLPLLINLPSLNVIVALLLAELHGLCGYFPAVLRLRPIAGGTLLQFEVAEIINLQVVRDAARNLR